METGESMTKPTKDEIARVQFIHAELDNAAKWYLKQHPSYDSELHIVLPYGSLDERVEHTYTAEEVRRWPEMKAELVATASDRYGSVAWSPEFGVTNLLSPMRNSPNGKAIARGLCLYREMLDAGPAREEQPEPAAKAPDPYRLPHDKNPNRYDEKRIAQVMIARDGAHNGKEPSARDRLIAALAAEQRDGEAKSILLKHPHPGRNFALRNPR